MTSQWTEESFTNEALAVPFHKISSTTWMQRRNIRKKTKTLDDETTYEYYTCESRVITNNEYISYLSDQNDKNTADIDYLAMMVDVDIPS